MTICIAVVCAAHKAVVVGCDRMLSAPFLTLEFDHPDAKIDRLSQSCVGLTAGDALVATELFAGFEGLVSQFQDPQVKMIAENVKHRFVELRQTRINDVIFQPRGISFKEFYTDGLISRLPGDIAMLLDSQVQQQKLDASVLVAGVDGGGAHIHGIDDPGASACFDRVGYHAIGSGHRHALLSLVMSKQHPSASINQTAHNVYEAKKQAELAQGVGQSTELRIITNDGVRAVSNEELALLDDLHNKRISPEMDEVNEGVRALPFEGGTQ